MDYSKPVAVTPPAQVPDHADNYRPAGCVLSLGSTARESQGTGREQCSHTQRRKRQPWPKHRFAQKHSQENEINMHPKNEQTPPAYDHASLLAS